MKPFHRFIFGVVFFGVLAIGASTLDGQEFAADRSSANSIRESNNSKNTPVVPKLAIARFASIPVLPVSSDSKGIPSQVEPERLPNPNAPSEPIPIPTILKNIPILEVPLDFLVVSSVTSRKLFLSFNTAVEIESATVFDFPISNQARQFALSQFDPNFASFLIGNDINRPSDSFFGPGLTQQNQIDEVEFNARLSKTWENGLISSVGYEPSLAYLFFPKGNSSGLNPTHSSDLVVRLEKPLLRGGGRDVNLVNVRIAETRALQSKSQIETAIQSQLRSIEQLYWRLHAEHVRLKAVDGAIELAQRMVQVVQTRFDAERAIYSDVARAKVKLEDLFQQRLSAELAIRNASFDLAQLSGLELEESVLLVPIDQPERGLPELDVDAVIRNAIAYNPSLRRQRQEIEVRRQAVVGAQNSVLPKLNLQASHRTSGLENDLGSALKQMSSYQFNDYSLGI
ncbi:MAG: TolC family protein, partial [Pirellula sp.]